MKKYKLEIMTNSLKLQSKRRKDEYINRVIYYVYVILEGRNNVVLARRDKDKGKDIDELFYILSQLLK